MGIVIENAELERLLHELAVATGRRPDDILLQALREQRSIRLPPATTDIEERRARLRAITDAAAREATHRHVTDDELVGYDNRGLPG